MLGVCVKNVVNLVTNRTKALKAMELATSLESSLRFVKFRSLA